MKINDEFYAWAVSTYEQMRSHITGEPWEASMDINSEIWWLMKNGMAAWLKHIKFPVLPLKESAVKGANASEKNTSIQTMGYSPEIISIFTDMALANLTGGISYV